MGRRKQQLLVVVWLSTSTVGLIMPSRSAPKVRRLDGKKKVDRETAYREKKAREAAAKKRRGGRATDVAPMELRIGDRRIVEDHNHEQYFFDDETLKGLSSIAGRHQRPLILCAPSLAAVIDRRGGEYLLLDRDTRFQGLKFQEFHLTRPVAVSFAFDSIFLDPPFANVTPQDLAAAVDALLQGTDVPLYVGYNIKREAELLTAFPTLQRTSLNLSYAVGVMPNQIALFANDLAFQFHSNLLPLGGGGRTTTDDTR